MMKTLGAQIRGRVWAGLIGLLVAGIFSVLAGCGEKQNSSKAVAPDKTKSESRKALSSTEQAKSVHPEVTEKTRQTYQWYCSQCHGNEGKGDGVNAKLLTVPPRNHTKADYLESRTDQQLFDAIKLGGLVVGRAPCMPAWGHTLDEKMIRSLVGYIRELCQCESID
jgi:mono/diheme cytochrome c family protein